MSEIEKPKNFEEKMKERIKESIGDLISDEELSVLVEKGIQLAFFTPTPQYGNYGSREDKPPLMTTILQDVLKEKVSEEVKLWMKENNDKVEEAMNKIIQEGLGQAVIKAFQNQFSQQLFQFQNGVMQQLQKN